MKIHNLFAATGLGMTAVIIALLALSGTAPPVVAEIQAIHVRPGESIQDAINQASTGEEIRIAEGVYIENLYINRAITLRGGWDTDFQTCDPDTHPTIIDGNGEHNILVQKDTPATAQVILQGLTLRNGKDGIHIWNGKVTVEDTYIHNVAKQGVEIDGGTVTISATRIFTAQEGLEADALSKVEVISTTIQYIEEECVLIEGAEGLTSPIVTIRDSKLKDCNQQGIDIDSGTLTVISSTIANTAREGLLIKDENNVTAPVITITQSTITGGKQQAVQARRGTLYFGDNHIHHVISEAFDIEGSLVTIDGNIIHDIHSGRPGIYITGTVATLRDNTIYAIDDHGIQARGSNSIQITGNEIYSTTGYGIYVREAEATINRNTIYDTGDHGIYVLTTTTTLMDNLVYNTDKRGIFVEGGNATIHNNTVHHTQGDGIRSHKNTESINVYNNTVYSGESDGIEVQGGSAIVKGNSVTDTADNGIKADNITTWSAILSNRVFGNSTGIAIRDVPVFTITNNFAGEHITSSIELDNEGRGVLYYNTLVGAPDKQQGVGVRVLDGLEVTLANNIIASHTMGISAIPTATLHVSNTLYWNNGDSPLTNTWTIYLPVDPKFVDVNNRDYHIQPESPAVDRGLDVGVETDIDGHIRPNGKAPDIGADELPSDYRIYLPLILRQQKQGTIILPPNAYQIFADPGALEKLASNPYSDETILATFVFERGWDVEMRYRGDTSRLMPKKSWKLFFPGDDLFEGQEELNLNADHVDQTLLRSAVGYDFLTRAGVPTPRHSYARLDLNGQYYGLFSQVEQIDERFLQRVGFNIHGNLYKPFEGRLVPPESYKDTEEWWDFHYSKKTNRDSGHADIKAFINLINNTPDADFPEAIAETLALNDWLDWYAANILLGNFEMIEKNHYYYHDLSTGLWYVLPWDVDLALGHNSTFGLPGDNLHQTFICWDNPIDSGTRQSPKNDGKWNALIDRIMNVPEFRYFHGRRLIEMMADEFAEDVMYTKIDKFFDYIQPYAEVDPNRWRPAGFNFVDGPVELKSYITNRHIWITEHLPAFMPPLQPPLTLNEIMLHNTTPVTDEAGEHAPWLELYNSSKTLTWDIGEMYLSDNPDAPTKWQIPQGTTLAPESTLLIWVDGEPTEGALHTNFTLATTGGMLGLWDKDVFDNASLFTITYTEQTPGIAYGRLPDGNGEIQPLDTPTPGWRNEGRPPVITGTHHFPTVPQEYTRVNITTQVTDDSEAITVTLWHRSFLANETPPVFEPLPMQPVGSGYYTATLPATANTAWVEYYIEAVDGAGMHTVDRPAWPTESYRYITGWSRPPLYINELMALNTRTIQDEQDKTPDWIEIYNAGLEDVDLNGMYLTDDIQLPRQHQITTRTIVPAGGYLLLWASEDATYPNHLNFKLSGAGEAVALFDSPERGQGLIDVVYFAPQEPDVAWGRYPDGTESLYTMDSPTPGTGNRLQPPSFSNTTRAPYWPADNDRVQITTAITAGTPVVTATLWLDTGAGFSPTLMSKTGTHYSVQIPPYPQGTLIMYYLEATDSLGQSTRYPAGAPEELETYKVGYTPPEIVINEFLADNKTSSSDEFGDYDDWVELYNAGPVTISLEGFYLSDKLDNPRKWALPSTTIAPGEFLLIWCDKDADQGAYHANFKLSRDGESIGLFDTDANGNIRLDAIAFTAQRTDISYGRRPNGTSTWVTLQPPTPGESNE